MPAQNMQEYNIATTEYMTFDELFPNISPVVNKSTANCTSRFDSPVPYDEQRADHADMPNMAPLSPCFSDESTVSSTISITGKFRNIEHCYHVDPRVLGCGHHGSVRECIERSSGQRFAVKSIRKSDPAVKPGGLAREITLLKEMDHHSIVRLVDVFEDHDYVHLVTDLCRGGELFDRITQRSSNFDNGMPCFSEDEAAKVMHQILEAVSYMHKRGVAHRDIKPENILFQTKDEDSPIEVIDFGLARKHHSSFEPPMSTIVGTPYYIAPDVLKKKYDKSCDLWSVGVIAYILLCGYPPFNGVGNDEVYETVKKGKYSFPSADWSYTSRESRDFIRRLLQRDPRKRMTVDQALCHPWILRHVSNVIETSDEERQDTSSVEVVFHGLSRRDSIVCAGSPLPRRRDDVRTALFVDL